MGRIGQMALLLAAGFLLSVPAISQTETVKGRVWTELAAANTEAAGEAPVVLPNLSGIVKEASPAVVSIVVEESARSGESTMDPLHDFFDRGSAEPMEGLGAGFIIDASGLVLTNAHVVENAVRIRVIIEERGFPRELEGKVVGADSLTDLALVKIEAGRQLPVLPLGDSDSIEVADWVVAIGNPFGLSHSVTFGIVSQKGRTDVTPQGRSGYFDFIQTDASINPGNSGGPLLNLRGEVVAINNAVNASGQGIGFAVPINMAKRVIPQLATEGKVTRAWIGLSIRDVPWELAQTLGLERAGGVVVSKVLKDSPAEEAGLKAGDVILEFEGRLVPSSPALRWEVACSQVGASVPVRILRDGQPQLLQVTLREQPDEVLN